jgi:hypothetical protein
MPFTYIFGNLTVNEYLYAIITQLVWYHGTSNPVFELCLNVNTEFPHGFYALFTFFYHSFRPNYTHPSNIPLILPIFPLTINIFSSSIIVLSIEVVMKNFHLQKFSKWKEKIIFIAKFVLQSNSIAILFIICKKIKWNDVDFVRFIKKIWS